MLTRQSRQSVSARVYTVNLCGRSEKPPLRMARVSPLRRLSTETRGEKDRVTPGGLRRVSRCRASPPTTPAKKKPFNA